MTEEAARAADGAGADWAARPHPARLLDNEFFWAGLAAGEVRIQRCDSCGHLQHPPQTRCMHCGSPELGYRVSSGRGEIFSFVVYHEPVLPGFSYPYLVGVVTLEEGIRVIANLLDMDPAQVRIGDPVRAVFNRVDDSLTLLGFVPATGSELSGIAGARRGERMSEGAVMSERSERVVDGHVRGAPAASAARAES